MYGYKINKIDLVIVRLDYNLSTILRPVTSTLKFERQNIKILINERKDYERITNELCELTDYQTRQYELDSETSHSPHNEFHIGNIYYQTKIVIIMTYITIIIIYCDV